MADALVLLTVAHMAALLVPALAWVTWEWYRLEKRPQAPALRAIPGGARPRAKPAARRPRRASRAA